MSAKSDRPRDRHGLALIDRTTADNHDAFKRWKRRWRFFQYIKREVEPLRQQLVAAHWRIERPALGRFA